jgi:hypothetical protein
MESTAYKILVEKPAKRAHSKDLRLDERIMLRKQAVRGLGSSGLGWKLVAGSCEKSNHPSGSKKKSKEFLEYQNILLAPQTKLSEFRTAYALPACPRCGGGVKKVHFLFNIFTHSNSKDSTKASSVSLPPQKSARPPCWSDRAL